MNRRVLVETVTNESRMPLGGRAVVVEGWGEVKIFAYPTREMDDQLLHRDILVGYVVPYLAGRLGVKVRPEDQEDFQQYADAYPVATSELAEWYGSLGLNLGPTSAGRKHRLALGLTVQDHLDRILDKFNLLQLHRAGKVQVDPMPELDGDPNVRRQLLVALRRLPKKGG